MDLQRRTQLQEIFEDIEEDIAFGTEQYTVIPCCQDKLTETFLCVYRKLHMFYEGDGLYESFYYKRKVKCVDVNELDFGNYGDYTRQEIAEYLEKYILGEYISEE